MGTPTPTPGPVVPGEEKEVLHGPEAMERIINAYTHAIGEFAVNVAAAQLCEPPFDLGVYVAVNETQGILSVDEAQTLSSICIELEESHASKLGTGGLARLGRSLAEAAKAVSAEAASQAGPKH